jgi:hypothetical protein
MKASSTASFRAFDELLARIKKRLHEKGPASSEVLASELGAPRVNVTFGLEVLSEGKEKSVERCSGDMWTLSAENRRRNGDDFQNSRTADSLPIFG